MDAPPVQYVRTSDGFDIAYTVCGEGQPFVFMPMPLNHVQLAWQPGPIRPWLEALGRRFRLVHYDSRGQGLSSRGLPADTSMDSWRRDLDAVVDQLALERFILLGDANFGHVAVRYAVDRPERVRALVLLRCSISLAQRIGIVTVGLAEQNWEFFLRMQLIGLPHPRADRALSMFKESVTQADWMTSMRVFTTSDVGDILPRLNTPTPVLHARDQPWSSQEQAAAFTALAANAHLVVIGGNAIGNAAEGVSAIERFFDSLSEVEQPVTSAGPLPKTLSPRQLEVLRLIATGNTTREIAHALVLSERTVERHVADVYAKIEVANRAQATAYAKDHGLA